MNNGTALYLLQQLENEIDAALSALSDGDANEVRTELHDAEQTVEQLKMLAMRGGNDED